MNKKKDYYMKKEKLMLGDNIESLKKLPENSIDSVVTDGPYGISFMSKKWDYNVPSVEFWTEVFRVLKPGGHLLSFGGTRTYHRMVVNIEDAGFEIRDQIQWLYSTGFPKSLNVSKQIDKNYGMIDQSILDVKNKLKELYKLSGKSNTTISKECGFNATGYIKTECNKPDPWINTLPSLEKWKIIAKVIGYTSNDMDFIFSEAEREVVGSKSSGLFNGGEGNSVGGTIVSEVDLTKSKTKEGAEWEGWGSALKPANEPICLARKPLSEKSIAENVLKWKTGGLNIDGCRVGVSESEKIKTQGHIRKGNVIGDERTSVAAGQFGDGAFVAGTDLTNGRFPANLILDESAAEMLDEQSGYLKSGEVKPHHKKNKTANGYQGSCYGKFQNEDTTLKGYGDGGGASRFFFNVKNTTENIETSRFFYQAKVSKGERNMGLDEGVKSNHPTVKPVNLMSYLCKLITPPNGIVLDPFMGSGSTGIAALLNDFRFVGMELDNDYFKIAEARINSYEDYRKFLKK